MFQIGIVAHSSRSGHARALAKTAGATFISFDDGLLGCEGNHRAVQNHLVNLPSTWSVILEDDAEPIDHFRDQLAAALPMAPTPIVSLYLGQKRPAPWVHRVPDALARAEQAGAHWIVASRLLHAVGYAIRTDLLASLLDHESPLPVDEHISQWARRYGHTVCYTTPSLVDHADMPTIVVHRDGQERTPGRKAWAVGGHSLWNSTSVPL